MPISFKITMNNQVFSIAAPVTPDKEFSTFRPSLPLNDDKLFEKSKRVTGLKVHWSYRSGLIRKVAGVIELQMMLQAARENNVMLDDGLKRELLTDFKQELSKIGYTGAPVQFDKVTINGRPWLRYQVPALDVTEYSTGMSASRFMTIRFTFIDNTGEKSPMWYQEANELMKKLVESMRVE